MPHIDLFNKSADEALIYSGIVDGTFRMRSKLYAKYMLKNAAQGFVVGGVIGLAALGALVIVGEALASTTEEETE